MLKVKTLPQVLAVASCLAACTPSGDSPIRPTVSITQTDAAATIDGTERCESLTTASIDNGTIVETKYVNAGDELYNFFQRTMIGFFVPDFDGLQAPLGFCRATAKLRPVSGSEITVEAWLPQYWNGKLLALGGGGLNGGLTATAPMMMASPLGRGYTTFVTDAGHEESDSGKFAYDNPEQLTDFAHRANHVAAKFSKELVNVYYDAQAEKAYFHGCSNGGRDALMEASRYPDDYDGIIAGAPASSWIQLTSTFAWLETSVLGSPETDNLEEKLPLIQNAVMEKCDAIDGLKDNLIQNPAICDFNPIELQCSDGDTSNCLTAEEVEAVTKIYRGPVFSDGSPLYPGFAKGGEALENNWDLWITKENGPGMHMSEEFMKWAVQRDPEWDVTKFNLENDHKKLKQVEAVFNSDKPDLSTFMNNGGKLLIYHGWNDAAISPQATIDYYNKVQEVTGPIASQNTRLFMVPGMQHCFGGDAPTSFDTLTALEDWVEKDQVPEELVATQFETTQIIPVPGKTVVRTRPLCSWPKVATYDGTGPEDVASSFQCK
ncbi:tannase/feruloyl esterase family alpha/beta hydrolase [Microbulbifer sp. SH-1]|uniref:tannase/feruloyl esterase family alpha/beta hydrolase n=1 Tax=Microbulbifer sp. SH-1 TaxID=2681547 RepID=UPI001407E5F8|nr:tannase/feruloyl esterase family alpha/beta hydrolase [Microbulbifer sp. SH-1]QIL91269.1 tannase/feruloyl esterase family alpha/beta hydrolase [Microbulbifer sp. SH-1]